MSYCRWSSDGMKCDVYVYQDYHGDYMCHVAGRKIVNLDEAPHSPSLLDYPRGENGEITDEALADFSAKHRAWMDWIQHHAKREDIGLEFDGKTFSHDSATSMANDLYILKQMGYQVPQYAIDALYEEGKENGEQAEL
mgnify:FL=1